MKNIATGKEVCSIFIFGSWEVSSMASGDESEPTTFRALLDLGRSLDLTGKELHEFAVKQQNLAREKDKESETKKTKKEKKGKRSEKQMKGKRREKQTKDNKREKRKKENERNMQ